MSRVLVTGGAGYVGAVLVPRLLDAGYEVTVLDLYLYGDDVLAGVAGDPRLEEVRGDIRDQDLLERLLPGCDAVIHLACISNDPSFELDPTLGRSINFDAFEPLVRIARRAGVRRFVYASSSSVYGVKETPAVTEDLPLEPLTDYSRFKALCEEVLLREATPTFVPVVLRPATVCGYSPRLRLDLTVNILTNLAVHKGRITVFGGTQMRPNIHVDDMADLYVRVLELPDDAVAAKTWNAGYENHTVSELAGIVRRVVGPSVEIETTPTDDLRSYHISSERIRNDIGFVPLRTVEDAVSGLAAAFSAGRVPGALDDSRYYNVKRMQELALA